MATSESHESDLELENTLAWVLGIRGDQMEYLSLQPDLAHALTLVEELKVA